MQPFFLEKVKCGHNLKDYVHRKIIDDIGEFT